MTTTDKIRFKAYITHSDTPESEQDVQYTPVQCSRAAANSRPAANTNGIVVLLAVMTLSILLVVEIMYFKQLTLGQILLTWAFGAAMTVFTWEITFRDSTLPGTNPPTPLSPEAIREQSGHTFHSGYTMAIATGFLVHFFCLWCMRYDAFAS